MSTEEVDILLPSEAKLSKTHMSSSDNDIVSVYIDNCVDYTRFWIICICLALGNSADAIEITCVGYILTDIEKISGIEQELLTSAVFVGMLFGGILCGYFSDIVGRKPVLLLSLGVNSLAGVLSAFAPTITSLIVIRMIGGLGIGGSVPIVFSVAAEVFPSKVRGRMISVIASFWMVGSIYSAGFAWLMLGNDLYGDRIYPAGNWRGYALLCALPVLIAFAATYYLIPESPRFLLHKGRLKEAAASLQWLCQVPVDEAAMKQVYVRGRINNAHYTQIDSGSAQSNDDDQIHGTDLLPNQRNSNNSGTTNSLCNSSIKSLFHKSLRRRTAAVGAIWFSLSFGSYGMSTWITTLFINIGLNNPYADSFIFNLANLPGNVVSIYMIDVIGRRLLLSIGMGMAGVSSLVFAFDLNSAAVVITAAALFNTFSVMAWNSLDCIAVEIFPTSVRTTAMGLLASLGRIGAVCAQFVNGSLQTNMVLLLVVTSVCMLAGCMSAWLLDDDSAGRPVTDNDDIDNENDSEE